VHNCTGQSAKEMVRVALEQSRATMLAWSALYRSSMTPTELRKINGVRKTQTIGSYAEYGMILVDMLRREYKLGEPKK
jgi:hypothetical protein